MLRALIDDSHVHAHRLRGLDPDRPVLRGTAQNPDVFFQAREAANPYYEAVPGIVQEAMDTFAEQTGRHYDLVDYAGHPEAERVLVLMGSGAGAVEETVEELASRGERVGVLHRAAVPAVPGRGASSTPCPTRCGASRCSTAPRSRARSASRCSPTWRP